MAKWNSGPLSHVLGFVTRVLGRRRVVDRVEFERRLYACVVRAEAEARAQDRMLQVRAR